jgi:hypothetical protein
VAYQDAKTRVLLAQRDGPDAKWSEPLEVAGPGDHFRVTLAGTADGALWIVWSSRDKGEWKLKTQSYKAGKLQPPPDAAWGSGTFIWHRMASDSRGRVWLVWQESSDDRFSIRVRMADAKGWDRSHWIINERESNEQEEEVIEARGFTAAQPALRSRGTAWDPVIASDPTSDRVWIGWDEYHGGKYRVCVRSISPGQKHKVGKTLFPEATPLFQAHVSLACDKDGRLWAAWDEAGPQWGKDTGFLYERGEGTDNASRLYASRTIRVRCLVDGKWQDPAADFQSVLPPDLREYNDYPQLQADADGRIWMAFRHRTCRRPRFDGWAAQGRWDVYATAYLGDRWLTPVELPLSGGRNDMRIASAKDDAGKIYFAYASDNRLWALAGMPPRNHHVAVSRLGSAPKPGEFKFVVRERKFRNVKPVHPKEAEQVARIRNYEIKADGKKYKIYRGDLHRHTDISGDGPGDGSLMDLHRYAIDAAALDFVLVADHNMGGDNEYCWWRTQQANDLYTLPGKFISMYGYERSVKYPNGHRNVIWTERGHRTLPIPAKPLPAALKGDTAKLYEYLRKTGGICTLHTSASDQGTNWEDPHDPALEPFVELFQGYHTSYESLGAPKAIDDKTDIIHGPYRADGFVNLALKKGYKLGFQSSSDHISTHVSYACVLAEEFSRKGLVDAMKKRHTYAATDNIVLDVRLGSNLMGDEVRTGQAKFDVVVLGTAPLGIVEILRNGDVVHTERDKGDQARFQWEDKNPRRGGKASYYYVRVRQKDGNMAWSSPMWVTAAGN